MKNKKNGQYSFFLLSLRNNRTKQKYIKTPIQNLLLPPKSEKSEYAEILSAIVRILKIGIEVKNERSFNMFTCDSKKDRDNIIYMDLFFLHKSNFASNNGNSNNIEEKWIKKAIKIYK